MRKDEKAHFGQKSRTETAADRSSHKVDATEAAMGRKMKGGPTDLSRSMQVGSFNDEGKAPGR